MVTLPPSLLCIFTNSLVQTYKRVGSCSRLLKWKYICWSSCVCQTHIVATPHSSGPDLKTRKPVLSVLIDSQTLFIPGRCTLEFSCKKKQLTVWIKYANVNPTTGASLRRQVYNLQRQIWRESINAKDFSSWRGDRRSIAYEKRRRLRIWTRKTLYCFLWSGGMRRRELMRAIWGKFWDFDQISTGWASQSWLIS